MLLWAILLETALLAGVIFGVLGLIHWKDRKKRLPFTQKILRPDYKRFDAADAV